MIKEQDNLISEYEKEIENKIPSEIPDTEESNTIIIDLYSRINDLEAKNRKLEKNKIDQDKLIDELNNNIVELNEKIKKEKKSANDIKERYKKLELNNVNFSEMEEKTSNYDKLIKEKDDLINELNIKNEELLLDVEQYELDKEIAEEKLKALQQSVSENNPALINLNMAEDLETLKIDYKRIEEENNEYKEKIKDYDSYENMMEKLTNDNMDLKDKIAELEEDIKTLEEYKDLGDEMEIQFNEYKQKLEQTIHSKDIEIQDNINTINILTQSIEDRDKMITLYTNQLSQIKSSPIKEKPKTIIEENIVNNENIKKYEICIEMLKTEVDLKNNIAHNYLECILPDYLDNKLQYVNFYNNLLFGDKASELLLKNYDLDKDFLNRFNPKVLLNELKTYHYITLYNTFISSLYNLITNNSMSSFNVFIYIFIIDF